MGQPDHEVTTAIGRPTETQKDLYDGIMLVYPKMPFQNRIFDLYLNVYDGNVSMVHAVDTRPETIAPLSLPNWQSVNFIGKTLAEILHALPPPQLYVQFVPPPHAPTEGLLTAPTNYLAYPRAEIAGIPYGIMLNLHAGRVENMFFSYKQDIDMDLPAFRHI